MNIKTKFVVYSSIFLSLFFLQTLSLKAFTETKTGEVSSSKLGDFIPSGNSGDATINDINQYLSLQLEGAELDEFNQCNAHVTEAEAYYNSGERQKCQDILNYNVSQENFDGFFNWFLPQPSNAPTEEEVASCKDKEDLVKKYTTYALFSDEFGYNYFNNPSPYYDMNCNCIKCNKDALSAAALGLGKGKNQYLSKTKIANLIGEWWSAGQGGTDGLWGWIDETENKYCLKAYPAQGGAYIWTHCFNFSAQEGYRFSCNHQNTYNFSFNYQTKKGADLEWSTLPEAKVNKCQDLRVVFDSISDFAANLIKNEETGGRLDFFNYLNYPIQHTPPTDILACSNQENCLALAKEYEITPGAGYYAKGVLKVPTDFNDKVAKSLTSSDEKKLTCIDGICKTTTSGNYSLSAKVPQTSYFGQCRENDVLINTPEQTISNISDSVAINVVNRAPVVSVSLSSTNPKVNDEITAICDIQDPDYCSDKIVKVKWTCLNDKKEQVACYFGKDGIWHEGTISEDVPDEKQDYQYRSIVKFKAGAEGVYALVCEGTDNDLESSLNGMGVTGVSIGKGEESAEMKYCAVTSEEGSTNQTVCGSSAKVNLKVFQSGIDALKYEWKCDKNDEFSSGNETKECEYLPGKVYYPGLRIFDKQSASWIDCSSENNSIKVTNQAKCMVQARPLGSQENFSSEVKTALNQPVEVQIKKECTQETATVWSTDGIKISSNNNKATIKFTTGGAGFIKASIGETQCQETKVTVDEKVNWGN